MLLLTVHFFIDSISTPDFHREPDSTLMVTVPLLIILTATSINGKLTLLPEEQSPKSNVVKKNHTYAKVLSEIFLYTFLFCLKIYIS